MPTLTTASAADDWGKWLTLGAALAGVGLLPKGWQKGLALAAAATWWLGHL